MNKHKINLLISIALAGVLIFNLLATTACQSNAQSKIVAVNQPEVKTTNDNQSPIVKAETEKSSAADSLATPTEAYKTAFAARQKKDLKALKRVLSKQMLDFFTDTGKDEKKTLDDELKELADQPQAAAAEARNEKIAGDRATLEYLDEHGKWKPMDLVKENGEWKLTMPAAPPAVVENTAKK